MIKFFSKKAVKLSKNVVNVTDIPPRELVTYPKETQTPTTENSEKDGKKLLLIRILASSNEKKSAKL